MAEAVPAWLAAWREGRCQQQRAAAPPAQPREQHGQGCSTGKGGASAVAEAQRPSQKAKVNYQGFVEPEHWPYDGGLRREPVLDTDHNPPRVIRKVGWRTCIACSAPFFSEDVIRLRLCEGIGGGCRRREARDSNSKAATCKETGRPA